MASSATEAAAEAAEGDEAMFQRICAHLAERGVDFAIIEHEAVRTSEEAMLMRRNTEKGDPMVLLVLSASEMLDWKRVRRVVGRGYKLALPADVSAASGALPGAVPPFGSLFTPPVKTMVDVSLRDQGDTVHFNAGLRTKSIRMRYADWAAVEHPEEVNVAAQG